MDKILNTVYNLSKLLLHWNVHLLSALSSSAYFNHLCSFTIPEYGGWLLVLVHTYLWRTRSLGDVWHGSDLQSSSADSCLHFLLSRKPPPSRLCPSCSSLLLASCCKGFSAASVSHFFPCQHMEHGCRALRLPPETFHRGPRRRNSSCFSKVHFYLI